MRRLSLFFLATIAWSINAYSQEDLTFYHLGNATPQSAMNNASYFPDAHFYFSLPVLSGINVNVGSSLSYNDAFSSIEGSDSVLFDLQRVSDVTQPGDRFNFNSNISLLQFGFSLGDKQAFTLFANERVSGYSYYPGQVFSLIADGNADHIGETISEDNFQFGGTHYREYGVGYSYLIKSIPGINSLRVGARVKYIQGFFDIGTDNLNLSITTNDDLSWTVAVDNAMVRSAGLSIDDNRYGAYLLENDNVGYGFDLGFDAEINSKLSVALAINDIGSIKWTEGVNNYFLADDSIILDGAEDLADNDASVDAILDSLEDFFEVDTSYVQYKKTLDTRYLTSVSYKVTKNGTATASFLLKNEIPGRTSFSYGIGYKQQLGRIFGVSGTISKTSNQSFDLGAGFDLRLGPVQMYTVVNNLSGLLDARKVNNVGGRFGINFMLGRRGVSKVKTKKEVTKKVKNETSTVAEPKKEKSKISPFPDDYDLDHLE